MLRATHALQYQLAERFWPGSQLEDVCVSQLFEMGPASSAIAAQFLITECGLNDQQLLLAARVSIHQLFMLFSDQPSEG